ncbi:MAG TPA: BACON domain-containing carbohydrate-binding protein [Bryobacteraceae bacterium]|nr:BACON domain-containing carbohydrate-binding protein [Bryobacteraceae bacterium]
MKTVVSRTKVLWALLLTCCWLGGAQSGPTANVTSINFTYTANSSTPPKTSNTNPFTVTLPSAMSSQTMVVTVASNPQGWLSVTPTSGKSPLQLTVSVNPTTLDPGNHSGTITIDTAAGSGNPAVVLVTIAIASAPPTLKVTVPSSTTTGSLALAYTYVTGSAQPTPLEVDVASSGDVIPFSVTAGNAAATGGSGSSKTPVWLRVNQSGLPPNLTTSGVALSGSVTQIFVTIDPTVLATLDPVSSPFGGVVTIAPTSTGSTASTIPSVTVTVALQILPGPPSLRNPVPIFPSSIPASPAVNPVITVYGNNFFGTTAVSIQQAGSLPIAITGSNFSCIGRTVIQITVASSYLTTAGNWILTVQNANQPAVSTTFTVTDPTQPVITSVVSAASYLPTAIQAVGTNPVSTGATSVSPREIIAIFGRNLGPSSALPITPSGSPATYPTFAGPVAGPVMVEFADSTGKSFSPPYFAPLILVSSNQVNCVVPLEVNGSVTSMVARVYYNSLVTPDFPVTVVPVDPGVFTFGGVGQGQAAILNFDSSTGSYTVNSSKTQAPRNSAISIFVTGVGDLDPSANLANGAVAPSSPINLAVDPTTVHVDIDGQPAVVTYAGTSPGAVAGLVQINAIVPLAASVSGTDSLTVSIGSASTSLRRSQPGVTIGVK